jgi:hypothetical protein
VPPKDAGPAPKRRLMQGPAAGPAAAAGAAMGAAKDAAAPVAPKAAGPKAPPKAAPKAAGGATGKMGPDGYWYVQVPVEVAVPVPCPPAGPPAPGAGKVGCRGGRGLGRMCAAASRAALPARRCAGWRARRLLFLLSPIHTPCPCRLLSRFPGAPQGPLKTLRVAARARGRAPRGRACVL